MPANNTIPASGQGVQLKLFQDLPTVPYLAPEGRRALLARVRGMDKQLA
jgi:hypothetical protein